MQAISIEEALNLFDPQRPLLEEFDIKAYYVARDNSPLAEMRTVLKTATDFPKLLFSGPPGCGKKTELVNLRESLKKDFHVIMFSIKDISNVYSVSLDRMLFQILLKIGDKAKAEKLKIYNEKLEKFFQQHADADDDVEPIEMGEKDKKSDITMAPEAKDASPLESHEMMDSFLEKIFIKKAPKSTANKIIELINATVWDLEEKTKKDVLVIVSDMDKISLPYIYVIFSKFVLYLTKINCFAIYTFPSEFKHYISFLDLYRNFSGVYFLPNFTISDRDGNPDEKGRAKLKEIISKRISHKLIYDDAIDLIIQLSGGVVYQLINLVRQSCIVALTEKIDFIDHEIVQTAERRILKVFNSVYSHAARQALWKVAKEKQMIPDSTFFSLIKQFSIIEYGLGDELWYDINPILKPLVENLASDEFEISKGVDHGKDYN